MNRKEYLKNWRMNNKKYMKEWRKSNKEKTVIYAKNWKEENPMYQKEYNKKWRINNKNYYKENRNKRLLSAKKYRKENKAKIKKYFKNHNKLKYHSNIDFKLKVNLRSRLLNALNGNLKSKNTFYLIGCNLKELKHYLKKQFKKGMTWKNHTINGWHIDHIKPCSSFNLSKPSEQRKCFHYTNLQPLWAKENYKKGNNFIKE